MTGLQFRPNLAIFLGLFAIFTAACSSSESPSSPAGAAGDGGGSSGAAGAGGASGSSGTAGTGGGGGAAGAQPATGSGTVNGTFQGNPFTTISSAWWIGKPGAGSAPTQIYLSDATLSCADLATAGWDKLLGTKQLLEFDLAGEALTTYEVTVDGGNKSVAMDASYVREPYNPGAEAGSVTLTAVNADKNIVGSYDLTFAGDNVKGTFDAVFCAEGVEP